MERITRSFAWMAAANISGAVFGAAIFIYLARALEPAAFGYFSYAQTIVFYMMNFVDLGLATYGMREVAKNSSRVSEYVSEIISFRFMAASFLAMALAAFVFLFVKADPVRTLLLEYSLMLFVSALASEWAFQGLEKMHMVFVSFISAGALQLLIFSLLVRKPADLMAVPLVYVVSYIPVIAVFLNRLRFRPLLRVGDLNRTGRYLSSSLVIWSISLFAQVYNNFDIVILGFFRSAREVGDFTIARRVVGGIGFLLVFLANAALPRLSASYHDRDMAQFRHVTIKFVKVAAILTVLLFIPAVFFGRQIILAAVGGQYIQAAVPLGIMLAGLNIVMFNLPFSTGLIAASRERDVLAQALASAVCSVALNLFLMPRYGMTGAAISFFLAEALGMVWILSVYRKRIILSTL